MHGLQLGKRGLDIIQDVSISVELPRDGEPDAFNHEGAKEHVQVNPAPPNMENMGRMGAVGYELKLQCAPSAGRGAGTRLLEASQEQCLCT